MRSPTVGAVLVEQANMALRVAKCHQVFGEDPHTQRRRIRLPYLIGGADWKPVASHQLSHRRFRPNPAEQLVLFPTQHDIPSLSILTASFISRQRVSSPTTNTTTNPPR